MKRKTKLILLLIVTLLVSLPVSASAVTEIISPPTESTINGIPESQIVNPLDVLVGPVFHSYTPNTIYGINKFKKIAEITLDNTHSSNPSVLKLTITQSTRQGSEWTGSINFSGEKNWG